MKTRIGKICVRCGAAPKEKGGGGCSVYGTYYKRHDYKRIKYQEVEVLIPNLSPLIPKK